MIPIVFVMPSKQDKQGFCSSLSPFAKKVSEIPPHTSSIVEFSPGGPMKPPHNQPLIPVLPRVNRKKGLLVVLNKKRQCLPICVPATPVYFPNSMQIDQVERFDDEDFSVRNWRGEVLLDGTVDMNTAVPPCCRTDLVGRALLEEVLSMRFYGSLNNTTGSTGEAKRTGSPG